MIHNFNQVIHCLHALVDSGSEPNLINTELAKQLNLLFVPLDPPILTTTLNNQVFAFITHQTEPVCIVTSGNHWETLILSFAFPETPLILSYLWLQKITG